MFCNYIAQTLFSNTAVFISLPKLFLQKMPVVTHADGCSVNITWWTSLVCPKTIYNTNCEFSDPGRNFCFDLKKLSEKNPPPVEVS